MVIDNQRVIIRNKLRILFFAILAGVVIVILLTSNLVKGTFLGLTKYHWAIACAVVYIAGYIYQQLLNIYYLYFSDEENNKLLFRFYPASSMNSPKQAIEIPKDKLARVEIKKVLLNPREEVTLYQETDRGIARYPSISLSGLNKEEKSQLKKTLLGYSKGLGVNEK